MKRDIIVINTAAQSGGALTILKQFVNSISVFSKENVKYHIFTSSKELEKYENENIKIVYIEEGNKYKNRVIYEKKYIYKWCAANGINPFVVVSLQNIGVKIFNNVPQVIYLHQPIPFRKDLKWSLMKKDERVYWMYKNIYFHLIKNWVKKTDKFIVQTNWMKKALVEEMQCDSEKIEIIKPNIADIQIEEIGKKELDSDTINLFYPTSKVIYKNYRLLFEVMKQINVSEVKYKLYITLEYEFVREYINEDPIEIGIIPIGNRKYEEILEYYNSADALVFPSYLETFGLPLIEAKEFNLPIIAANLEYAREVLGDYENVKYVVYFDIEAWKNEITKLIKNKKIKILKEDKEEIGWEKLVTLLEEYL